MPGYKITSDRDIKCVLCLLFVKDKKERNWTDKINIYIINCNYKPARFSFQFIKPV